MVKHHISVFSERDIVKKLLMCSKILHFCAAIKIETKTFAGHLDAIIYRIHLIQSKKEFTDHNVNYHTTVQYASHTKKKTEKRKNERLFTIYFAWLLL